MYTISVPNAQQALELEDFGQAREVADELAKQLGVVIQVEGMGIVAYATSPAAIRKATTGEYFTPNTRIENPKFAAPILEGYVPAYVRRRIQATVYRETGTSNLKIHDGRTGGMVDSPNCKDACRVTKEMRHGRML